MLQTYIIPFHPSAAYKLGTMVTIILPRRTLKMEEQVTYLRSRS